MTVPVQRLWLPPPPLAISWPLLCVLCALAASGAPPGRDPGSGAAAQPLLELLDAARGAGPALGWDARLAGAAAGHAAELEQRGVLDHAGRLGDRVADRVRCSGVTDTRLGEVLGAGPDEGAVFAAWMRSPTHRVVILDPMWTHVGVGRGPTGRVFVVVFAARRVAALSVDLDPRGRLQAVRGRLLAGDAVRPILILDLAWIEATTWDPTGKWFRFDLPPAGARRAYTRLGYVSSTGALVVTDVLRDAPDDGDPLCGSMRRPLPTVGD
jgi:hypothetical protein